MATNAIEQARGTAAFLKRYADWIMGLGVLGVVLTLVSPIPPAMLDILLAITWKTYSLLATPSRFVLTMSTTRARSA